MLLKSLIQGQTRQAATVLATALFLLPLASSAFAQTFEQRFAIRAGLAEQYLFENISPSGAAVGAVVASPSRQNPDYFYHWVRDAALVMNSVLNIYERTSNPSRRQQLRSMVFDYTRFSRNNQQTMTLTGLGEPKFHADGRSYTDPWGRPQNDSPALRAITLIHFANILLNEGKYSDVVPNLYFNEIPANSIIKRDLEYVAYNWKNLSFDIWEEVLGQHFYTLLVQRRSLVDGASLAERLGDKGAAQFYRDQAAQIGQRLQTHRDFKRKIFLTTLRLGGGVHYKSSQLDSQVILAINHARGSDGFMPPSDDLALSTFHEQERAFANLYPINQMGHTGVGIGRYPEDRYDGYTTSSSGNPWFISTLGFAEFLYLLKADYLASKKIEINNINRGFFRALGIAEDKALVVQSSDAKFQRIIQAVDDRARAYVERSMFHGDTSGRLSEQFNLYSGFMQGSHDLTWSYASMLSAYLAGF